MADYFDCDVSEVNQTLIDCASQVDPKYEHKHTKTHTLTCTHILTLTPLRERNTSYIAHAKIVVKALLDKDLVFEFQRRWRQHFLDTMKPRFLPDLWCVDHNPS